MIFNLIKSFYFSFETCRNKTLITQITVILVVKCHDNFGLRIDMFIGCQYRQQTESPSNILTLTEQNFKEFCVCHHW